MMPDLINGLFELGGALLLMLNVARLHRDKVLCGVSALPTAFFTAWGLWNLWFYPSLDQWFSFFGGVILVIVNAVWVGQVYYYGRKKR